MEIDADTIRKMDAYSHPANYLSVGQIYLYANPCLREPLRPEHIKPRLLGHWGTTPGQNFIYVHLNRVIKQYDLDMIYISGPGHGGPALVANTYLEGTYSEVYPNISQDEVGMAKLFKQFSFPGGIPSHVPPETPGSIHEGGELGYSLSHAFGAVFDNPDLIAACVIGDGEAETGPLATAWHSNKFLNPVSDGAVLPILHLNGYKIANPTILDRIGRDQLDQLLRGYGYEPYFVEGDDPEKMHPSMAAVLDEVIKKIKLIQATARSQGFTAPPHMAHDCPTNSQRMDRTSCCGWYQDRRNLSCTPSTSYRGPRCTRTREVSRSVDEELSSGGTLRQHRPVSRGIGGTSAPWRTKDGRKSTRERRSVAARSSHARL